MISATCVLAWNANEHGRVTKAKARLVARGISQRGGIDYFEIFGPTPTAACIHLLTATACELDFYIFVVAMPRRFFSVGS